MSNSQLCIMLIGISTACTSESEEPKEGWFDPCPSNTIEERLIDVGDVSLNVGCRGDGPTLVLLHGFPEFHYAWDSVMDELAGDYRLIAPDQRGYNLSDKPEEVEAYELSRLTQDISNLLPLVSEEPVILLAHDWGGPVGWLVAHTPGSHIRAFISTNGPHPVRFAELIENDPAQQEASSYMELFRSPQAESVFTPEVFGDMFSSFLTPTKLQKYYDAWHQPGAITGGLNWYRANDLNVAAMESLIADRSPTVNVPTIVLWGEDDDAVLVSNAEGLEPFVPDLAVRTFPGVDHWIEHRIPGEIANAIYSLDGRTR